MTYRRRLAPAVPAGLFVVYAAGTGTPLTSSDEAPLLLALASPVFMGIYIIWIGIPTRLLVRFVPRLRRQERTARIVLDVLDLSAAFIAMAVAVGAADLRDLEPISLVWVALAAACVAGATLLWWHLLELVLYRRDSGRETAVADRPSAASG